jgi:hypothetical protein
MAFLGAIILSFKFFFPSRDHGDQERKQRPDRLQFAAQDLKLST